MTSALTNQLRVFKAYLTQTERVFDDVTRKIDPLDFNWSGTFFAIAYSNQALVDHQTCIYGKNEILIYDWFI